MYTNPLATEKLRSALDKMKKLSFFQRGISLIELIVFMVIMSVAVSGVLLVMNKVTGHSADSLLRKQALASAESLLEEIQLRDFTAVAANATVTLANRTSVYHIVSDYDGFATVGIYSATTGALVPGLTSYNAAVAVTPTALGGIAVANSVLITVTVTDPEGNPMRVSGYRTNY
jgi:MSHA pilin protein MshD